MAAGVMLLLTLACRLAGDDMVHVFSADADVIAVGTEYLRIVSWTFAASGIIYVASSMFQALGHTLPALVASLARIVLVAIPAFILSRMPGFQLHWIWYLSVFALLVQLAVTLLLLQREMGRRLAFAAA
jgi:Na+-driven multidrug efflux pump